MPFPSSRHQIHSTEAHHPCVLRFRENGKQQEQHDMTYSVIFRVTIEHNTKSHEVTGGKKNKLKVKGKIFLVCSIKSKKLNWNCSMSFLRKCFCVRVLHKVKGMPCLVQLWKHHRGCPTCWQEQRLKVGVCACKRGNGTPPTPFLPISHQSQGPHFWGDLNKHFSELEHSSWCKTILKRGWCKR